MIHYLLPSIVLLSLLPTLTHAQAYCTTAPPSVYVPTYSIPFDSHTTVTPPLPCPGVYAVQEGYCCSDGFSCANSTCICSSGPPIYTLPLAPCASLNPYWNGCPGNMLKGLCCSGPGIFIGGDYNSTEDDMTAYCWRGATAVFTVTEMAGANGTEVSVTKTLPPGLSYTDTRCYTCPLYTRTTRTSRAEAGRVTGLAGGEGRVVEKVVLGVVVLLAGL